MDTNTKYVVAGVALLGGFFVGVLLGERVRDAMRYGIQGIPAEEVT